MKKGIIVLLFFCLVTVVSGCHSINAQEITYSVDELYAIALNGTLELDTDDAAVTIIGSEREDVHLKLEYRCNVRGILVSPYDLSIKEVNGNLKIQDRKNSGVMIMSTDVTYTILIEVPQGVSLNLIGDDDRYQIVNISGNVSLDMDDGIANLSDTQSDVYNITMDDGVVRLDDSHGKLYARIDDGDLICDDSSFHRIDVKTDDGTVDIATDLADDGYYRFVADDGHIVLDVLRGGGEFTIDGGGVFSEAEYTLTYNSEEMRIYELAGGSANVTFTMDDGTVTLQ